SVICKCRVSAREEDTMNRLNTAFLSLFALGALLAAPDALRAQTLYISNTDGTIDKVSSTGSVSTFATVTGLSQGLAFDSKGNLYVAIDNTDQIMKITPSGAVSLFATLPAGSVRRSGLAFDSSGNLYAATYSTNQISKISPDGLTVSAFATVSTPWGLAF